MSRSVLQVINEGLIDVGLSEVDDKYVAILEDFYRNCQVIDPKKNRIPKRGKYNMEYSCFDNKRNHSLLEITIDNDNVVLVSQTALEYKKNITLESDILVLEEQLTDLLSKSLLLQSDGGLITINYEDKEETEKITYDKQNKLLSNGIYVESPDNISNEIYMLFKGAK